MSGLPEALPRFHVCVWMLLLFFSLFAVLPLNTRRRQRAAGNMGGFVPTAWQEACRPFMDSIPPRDFKTVIAPTIEAELGRPLGEVFESIEEEPVGCASIGQAHRAVLKVGPPTSSSWGEPGAAKGRRVVVKIQDPSAERFFRGDVLALKTLTDLFFPQGTPAFKEIEKQFATEVRSPLSLLGFGGALVLFRLFARLVGTGVFLM